MKSLAIPAVITTVSALNVIKEKTHQTVDQPCQSTANCEPNKHCTNLLGHQYCADNTSSYYSEQQGGGCSLI